MTERISFFAPCPSGVEQLLAEELRRLGLKGVRPQRSGVLFAGAVSDGLRAVYCSRLATRVLLKLAEVEAGDADALGAGVEAIAWEDHLRATGTLAVDATGVNDALRNTQFTAVRVKDAVADRFRSRFGRRPSVDVSAPDIRINVAVRDARATISLDLAGEPLHRRGYREPGVQVAAPMKETLAAAVIEAAGWRLIAEQGGAFVDPMCGSATLAIEAALAAGVIAPGLIRRSAPVERWLGFDTDAWARIAEDAARRREAGLASLPPILATDADPRAVEIARRCVHRAGLEGYVQVDRVALGELAAPEGAAPGLIATNPPWGERLSERSALPALYAELARGIDRGFGDWRLAVVSPDERLESGIGMQAQRSLELGRGKGGVRLRIFAVGAPGTRAGKSLAATHGADTGAGGHGAAVRGTEQYANRLRKMARHHATWARRTGVTCYRVYDADLPDFALAVDVYGAVDGTRFAHIAEYAPPAEIDPAVAESRLDAAMTLTAEVLGIEGSHVFVKRRERQRGSAQYERLGRHNGRKAVVAEGGLRFEVNLTDYLDTGLFLDHRDTRAWLRELAGDERFLNLFAYTGTASVYAAAGGARSTTTVDLSATYLEWAQRNFALNDLAGEAHTFVRADVIAWLDTAAAAELRYDLIFCDPPTFSNSKRMDETWDVQRDHASLLLGCERLLAENGTIMFSCNRRRFELDEDALSAGGLVACDVTARTIPRDFERRREVHRCWTLSRGR